MGLPSRQSAGAPQARSCRAGQRHAPDLRGHAGLPQLAGQLHPLTCKHRRPGNRQEELASAWFTSLTMMSATQRGGQLTPPTT
jgi:hypothetical protein